MFKIGPEVIFLHERSLQWCQNIFITIYGLATFIALQMMMMTFFIMVIYKLIAQFAFDDAASFFQNVQCAVDCRLVNPWHLCLNVTYDFSRGDMSFDVMDDIRN